MCFTNGKQEVETLRFMSDGTGYGTVRYRIARKCCDPGKDGSAEMNEAYAAHESLMPIGPSFSVATLLEWTPESDPDARYSRASIPMANREGGFVVNPKANPEAKLMLCSWLTLPTTPPVHKAPRTS